MYTLEDIDCQRSGAANAIGRRLPATLPDVKDFLIRVMDRLAEWQERGEQRRRLSTLTDRMLADIGVDRARAFTEAQKPFWRP